MKFAEYAKMYVALAGLIANALITEATFLPAPWLYAARVVAIIATAFAVWKVENRDPKEFETQYFEGQ